MFTIALPKGRLGKESYELFSQIGLVDKSYENDRKLVYDHSELNIRYLWVKSSDVHIFVERNFANIGITGKDLLLEYSPSVNIISELDIGKCCICMAGKENFDYLGATSLTVATKYTHITEKYFKKLKKEINVVKLHGSIEIAPIIGMADVIVDIVETGETLRSNGLKVLTKIVDVNACIISNSKECESSIINIIFENLNNKKYTKGED